MSTTTFAGTGAAHPLIKGASLYDGARFIDKAEPAAHLDAVPQVSGNIEITVGIETGEPEGAKGYFVVLPAEQRAMLAAVVAGDTVADQGQPVRNPGRFRVILETGGHDWQMTPEEFDKMWARAGWHVRNGLPGFAQEGAATLSVNEVAPGKKAPRGTREEVRRHYRYRVAGSDEWKYSHNYKAIQVQKPVELEFQRTFKSEWEKA